MMFYNNQTFLSNLKINRPEARIYLIYRRDYLLLNKFRGQNSGLSKITEPFHIIFKVFLLYNKKNSFNFPLIEIF